MSDTQKKSDLSRAFSEDGELKTHVGGQALLEGIMMRGKYNWSVAVREPDGVIYTEEHDLASGKDKNGWLYWPFVRGCRAFVESLMLGYKALSIAAEHAFVEEDEEGEEGEEGEDARRLQVHGESGQLSAPDAGQLAADAGETAHADASEAMPAASGERGGVPVAADERAAGGGVVAEPARDFSWSRDFGNPDEMIDALAAQRTLQVVDAETGLPVRFEDETADGNAADGDARGGDAPDRGATDRYAAGGDVFDADARGSNAPGGNAPDGEAQDAFELAQPAAAKEKKPLLGDKEMLLSMVLGLVLGVALFIVAPAFITNLIVGEYDERTLLWNIVDGVLRIAVFIFYIWLIGRMSDIKRMFGYHGAEHKTIHCFEHGLPLTPENARSFPRLHVRCGTAFLIMVMIIAIFVYTITPIGVLIDAWGVPDGPLKLALVILVRIVLMPVIAGVSYEITVKWAGSHPDNPLVKVVLWPGMQMQRLTTREPDDGQIECAIRAMQMVLDREQREEALARA
ncbi:MAG TPA: DUF1385 domain-containing protein [Eggerthellaceae bacterium]|nr:DUF1385 domain-containing protein [Eggerthellaceae bacterium]